jgi:hypothetical protein
MSPPGDAGYSGTPLSKKLGIKPGMTVALVGAPAGFAETLGQLPADAKLRSGARGKPGLVIWFVNSAAELGWEIRRISGFAVGVPLWIAWRKKTAPAGGASRAARAAEKARAAGAGLAGPSENEVRDAGLAAGLVDYKVCAIDATWSGLLFATRRGTTVGLRTP